ncbi:MULTISPECIES: alcohol dehydrogenase catalytic domain-containing protein [unclassified Saccharopolyspora]|uniref:alcohol dehydrogenase catalytic domain-containing protein n=1 Tax=unclassified Saccharopolyspora TaxID=2646250 RepID=UPI001CD28901|nr:MULTISPECIES: alcohol dehydrogenase catalytic domain-containing protein [unclassified Saccharopolyspora]MCA1188992.1 alcohol dehydrogenase catalytic domain-containing protein [Saccharopolyspora sp. 6T]MCA1194832.1 alcohol dehydrogenase catalytic domain-containing protein [Saccharopolyspora sp. 6V]
MRELQFRRSGRLVWHERAEPVIEDPGDALVRPFLAGRCDGDTLPIHRPVSRALQAGMALGLVDPVIGSICGSVPFQGPFAIGHECVAEIVEVGPGVARLRAGQRVVVPWAISCGACPACLRGLTSKCGTTVGAGTLAAYGFGPASGEWGGMVADRIRVPFAEHMLVPVPDGVPSTRVAAASDNLADAWRAVVPGLTAREGGSVLVLGGGAKSIGLYAAGLAAAHGATAVDYLDDDPERWAIAESLGARAHPARRGGTGYDVVVEATSRPAGLRRALRALAPGGICTAVGYYVGSGTRVPLMRMYAMDGTLRVGVSHARATLPELLGFLERTGFPAERVTTRTAEWDAAPAAYATRTTKLVLARTPLDPENGR